jgi:hypothetical protein
MGYKIEKYSTGFDINLETPVLEFLYETLAHYLLT